jgi:dipeptidyl aminopeptidase/acylaminoacyl peptidase
MRIRSRAAWTPLLLMLALATAASAQQKPTLEPSDYGKWENVGSGGLSPDGQWIAYTIRRVDGDGELRWRSVRTDSQRVVAHATNPAFSDDGRWLAYNIGHSEKARKAAEKTKATLHGQLGLVDLRSGHTTVIDDIASFEFNGDGRFLAMKGYAAKDQKHKGVPLIVRDLAQGTQTTLGNVAESAWQDESGSLLAATIDTETKVGNGVQLFDAATGVIVTLDSDTATYKGLSWRREAADLAVFKVRADSAYEGEGHVVLAWQNAGSTARVAKVFDPRTVSGFPADTRVVDFRSLEWADNGGTVYLGIQAWERKEPPAPKVAAAAGDSAAAGAAKTANGTNGGDSTQANEDKPGVEVWHAGDVDIMPQQKVRAEMDRRRNYLAAWHLANDRFVEVANELTEDATIVDGLAVAVGTDATPYEREGMFGPYYRDLYIVDSASGERTLVKERVQFSYGASPGGKYALYAQDGHYFVYDVARRTHVNVTEDVPTSFVNLRDDHTVPEKPPFGVGGWTPGDRSLLLYDEYDVWELAPDGSTATNLTNGANDRVRHRIVRLDLDERTVDPSRPVYVALYGDRSKQYGYGTMQRGKAVERMVFLDANVSRLTKADNADVYSYVVQSFSDSPDYFVGGARLADAKQVSETNAFQKDYAWSEKSELIDFRNEHGVDLQAALHYPANYDPSKKYPMLVYIYEITSNQIHGYSAPSERSAYNATVWTQEGYFVLRPDIVYRDRNPGLSAVEALVPAVKAAVATGMIDEQKVGLIGHSWGGYQTAFVPTQTDIFAAAVAGAPLTELYTMYLSVYWNSGGTDARIFEISQGRMEVPPWHDLESYLANSPVHHIQKLKTPMLVAFGDKDGAVDWHQGIVMYNAARRENKDLVMLVYEGENHGLAKEPNQIDYHRRVMDWFNHYLKGEPAPEWIRNGVPFLEKDKEKRIVAERPISQNN